MKVLACILSLLATAVASSPLSKLLGSLKFVNNGTTHKTDTFVWDAIRPTYGEVIYLEAYNVSAHIAKPACGFAGGWSRRSPYPYLFQVNSSAQLQCMLDDEKPGFDRMGGNLKAYPVHATPQQNATVLCANMCCQEPQCNAFVYVDAQPSDAKGCTKGSPCCWLKDKVAAATPSADKGITSAVIPRGPSPPPPPPPIALHAPPSGIRSAVPVGGLSCGSFELRGDGSFHEWTIMNQSPGGSPKIQEYEHSYLALKVGGVTKALQTNPFAGAVPGVDAITYGGSFPVSRLQVHEASFSPLDATLYAYSAFKANSMPESARPAAAFSVTLDNSGGAEGQTVSFMFHLPLSVESDQDRPGTPLGHAFTTPTAGACAASCREVPACMSWTWVDASASCQLQSDTPTNGYSRGVSSGVRGEWEADEERQCLTLVRPGSSPSSGNVSLCVALEGALNASFDYGTSDDARDLFRQLETALPWEQRLNRTTAGTYGAVALTADVAPGSSATMSITMGWNFPQRDHFAQTPGNYYSTIYADSLQAAWGDRPATERSSALQAIVSDISEMHKVLQASSVPDYMQDQLLNSLSHVRSAMWFEECKHCHRSADNRTQGFWRQWEAYDCADMDSIHNDGERHLPYLFMFPNSSRNKLAAWAGNQQPNGMLAEQILNTDPDSPQGRVMADATSMFIFYILELVQWAGDKTTLDLYYPTVKRAAMWQMNVSAALGVPKRLQTTYDVLGFDKYDVCTYATVFHIAAMLAVERLATVAGDDAFAETARGAGEKARAALDELQWNGRYYDAASSGCTPGVGCNASMGQFSDSFNGQLYAFGLGLGPVVANVSRLAAHQELMGSALCKQVVDTKLVDGCPNGLLTLTGRTHGKTDWQIWEMGSYTDGALALYLGQSPSDALVHFEAAATSWSRRMNDQWNTAGIKDTAGYPTITSHYGYHMISWHAMLALSGQVASLWPGNSTLSFQPRVQRPFSLPVLLPGVIGLLSADGGSNATLTISNITSLESLTLDRVVLDGVVTAFGTAVTLRPGQSVSWAYPRGAG